ncbi:MAG TPA: hypothetical protein VKA60_12150 [Blastocatellia bacterium]|nr:hypothetical protein [Blastocatellia bacterium]
MVDHIDTLKQVNKSGFPFQLRVQEEIERTVRQHHWLIAGREHAWSHPRTGATGFIDLVLSHSQYVTFRLVIECKRMKANDARQLRWIFLVPDQELKPTSRTTCLEVETWTDKSKDVPVWSDIRLWDDVSLAPESLQSEFCILPNDEQRRQSILESLAVELLDSVEGLAQEEVNVAGSQSPPDNVRLFTFPAIVTNAEIAVCHFNPSVVNIQDGTLKESDVELSTVPFIRFRKSLSTAFPEGRFYDLKAANRARARTVFVVNAASLPEFLTNWEISPFGGKYGYATQLYINRLGRE